MVPPLRLNAVAFISSNNHPILIRTFTKHDDSIKYHYIAHTSLDVIEERGQPLISFHPYSLTQFLCSKPWKQGHRMFSRPFICLGGCRSLRIHHAFEGQNSSFTGLGRCCSQGFGNHNGARASYDLRLMLKSQSQRFSRLYIWHITLPFQILS